ncbi:MAG: MotA/TolQ/ExbB proton channel family protein [Lentisphaerae bacterium]|jgi:biopolymer transport protein ExbB|nr:MotA/TolQ/ExbB proton channel family protein [Lentisphaerota bacterium]
MKVSSKGRLTSLLLMGIVFGCCIAFGQEAEAAEAVVEQQSAMAEIWEILYGGSIVNLLIWIGIFATSFMTVIFAVNSFINVKAERIMPHVVIDGVQDALQQGDLDAVIATCDTNPSPLSSILRVAFNNIEDGYDVVQQAVASATDLESEKIMQKVNHLNVCGQIAPMLGLLGTVVGMVMAFAGLASASGAAKTKVLARSISTALWTTCVGLLISVPALLFFTYFKNNATRLLLESEAKVLDLIKVLRNVEVE